MYVTTFSSVRGSHLYNDLYHPTSSHLKMRAFMVNYYCSPTHTVYSSTRVLLSTQPHQDDEHGKSNGDMLLPYRQSSDRHSVIMKMRLAK